MTQCIGPCTSALAIAWSRTLNTSLRDCRSHHEVWIISCQWGIFAGLTHRVVAPLTPIPFRAVMSASSIPALSSPDKLVQSRMQEYHMGSELAQEEQIQTVPLRCGRWARRVARGEAGWVAAGIVTLGEAGESGHRLQCPAELLRSLSCEPKPPLR